MAHFGIQNFDFVLKTEWASSVDQYRQAIRRYIYENIYSSQSILQLDHRPIIQGRGLSISHNKNCGGFVTSTDVQNLGFDIESNHRFSVESMARFSANKNEVLNAPSAACLWTAKEAAFKAVPAALQVNVIAEVEIGGWKQESPNLYTCRILTLKSRLAMESKGLVLSLKEQTLAFFTAVAGT